MFGDGYLMTLRAHMCVSSRVTPSSGEVTSSSQTPPLIEEGALFQNTQKLERTKLWSWVPTGPETKNDCAGQDQQHWIGLYCIV
jgi:hypothetical protein